jgi:hypothetical protein
MRQLVYTTLVGTGMLFVPSLPVSVAVAVAADVTSAVASLVAGPFE